MSETPTKSRNILLGMSGGLDSSMAALMLLRAGHRVTGVTMRIWDASLPIDDVGRSGCYGPGEEKDIAQAQAVARRLGIAHHVIPLASEYRACVIDYVRSEYLAGRTPNPCVRCNQRMKFGFLLEHARRLGIVFDTFATGHYARIEWDDGRGRYALLRAHDRKKDQSYFLSHLSQAQLSELCLPLGAMFKNEVRDLAREQGWDDLCDRPESQDFIECDDYGVLFGDEETLPGPIKDSSGKVLGEHRGIVRYTIGQRRGLGLSGHGEPLFVTDIDAAANVLSVGPREALLSDIFYAVDVNWVGLAGPPVEPLRIQAAIRQRHRAANATLESHGHNVVRIRFDQPQSAITPGQIAVFYEGDLILGGGTICMPEQAAL